MKYILHEQKKNLCYGALMEQQFGANWLIKTLNHIFKVMIFHKIHGETKRKREYDIIPQGVRDSSERRHTGRLSHRLKAC